MHGAGGRFDPYWKPYEPPDPNQTASNTELLTDATRYCNRRMQPDYIREEMDKGAAAIDEVRHIAGVVDQATMESGGVHQGGLELMERVLDTVALAAMRTAMNEATADCEALTALKALYFGLFKRVYAAKDALNTRCLAIDHKGSGNVALKAGRFTEAIEWYTKVQPLYAVSMDRAVGVQAVELEPNYVYFANRSAAFLALDSYEEALQDANMSIRSKPSYLKVRAAPAPVPSMCAAGLSPESQCSQITRPVG